MSKLVRFYRRFLKKDEPVKEEVLTAKPAVTKFSHSAILFEGQIQTDALGRNGVMKCIGLDLMATLNKKESCVQLSPVNSKGNVGRCHIEIPKKAIPALMIELEVYYLSVS